MAIARERINVEVTARTETGKNACRRIRAAGKVPANVYGLGLAPFSVSVDPRRVEDVLKMGSGRNTIFRLALAGGTETRDVMLREMQRDPVSGKLVHVDFARVDLEKPVTVDVPVLLEGIAEGVKNEGGIMDFVQRSIQVSCLPLAIPESLAIDVSGLHLNQHVAVSDLRVDEGVTILDDPSSIIAVVVASRAEIAEEAAVEEPEEEEGAEEPAVISKGKEAEGEKQQEESKD
jgi:large subunit ribosomal protein L25